MSGTSDNKSGNGGNTINGISVSGNGSITGHDIKVTIRDVSQSIAAMPNTNADEKEQIKQLFAQLQDALKNVPQQHADDAALVATRSEQLAQEAAQAEVDKEEVEHKANKLRQAAEKLKDAMPVVLEIAMQIVAHIVKSSIQ